MPANPTPRQIKLRDRRCRQSLRRARLRNRARRKLNIRQWAASLGVSIGELRSMEVE